MQRTAYALAFGAWLVGCTSVEGVYTLDRAETKKSMEADIEKLPADQRQFAKLGLAMMGSDERSIELRKDGTSMLRTSNSKDLPKDESGTWRRDGDKVVITDGKGKVTTCDKSGKKLKCIEARASGDATLVFTKGD